MSKNDGKYLERIVLLIEESIDPSARVKHNVQMPILNSREGNTTQCDIVVWSGNSPRETITIIEVQDRKSQVKPNDFRGWLQKLEDVGAQHLICVSRQEFPSSIKEKALLAGNKIHLINIKDTHPDKIPLNFFKMEFKHLNFEAFELNCLQFLFSKEEAFEKGFDDTLLTNTKIQHSENCFSFDKIHLVSIFELCRDEVDYRDDDKRGIKSFKYDLSDDKPLFYYYGNQFIRVGFHLEFKYEREIIFVPINILSYEQCEDTLAWVLESSYISNNRTYSFRMPIYPSGDKFRISNMEVELPTGSQLTMTMRKINQQQ